MGIMYARTGKAQKPQFFNRKGRVFLPDLIFCHVCASLFFGVKAMEAIPRKSNTREIAFPCTAESGSTMTL